MTHNDYTKLMLNIKDDNILSFGILLKSHTKKQILIKQTVKLFNNKTNLLNFYMLTQGIHHVLF